MTSSEPQLFTVDDANKRLPLIKAIVKDIVALASTVEDRTERLNRLREGRGNRDENLYSEELEQSEQDLQKDSERLEVFVEELEKLGVELQDPVLGLVNFRSRFDGREVYLCWRHGEDEVAYWHELDETYDQRQSLLEGMTSGNQDAESDS